MEQTFEVGDIVRYVGTRGWLYDAQGVVKSEPESSGKYLVSFWGYPQALYAPEELEPVKHEPEAADATLAAAQAEIAALKAAIAGFVETVVPGYGQFEPLKALEKSTLELRELRESLDVLRAENARLRAALEQILDQRTDTASNDYARMWATAWHALGKPERTLTDEMLNGGDDD